MPPHAIMRDDGAAAVLGRCGALSDAGTRRFDRRRPKKSARKSITQPRATGPRSATTTVNHRAAQSGSAKNALGNSTVSAGRHPSADPSRSRRLLRRRERAIGVTCRLVSPRIFHLSGAVAVGGARLSGEKVSSSSCFRPS
jgi:hypothetical protein